MLEQAAHSRNGSFTISCINLQPALHCNSHLVHSLQPPQSTPSHQSPSSSISTCSSAQLSRSLACFPIMASIPKLPPSSFLLLLLHVLGNARSAVPSLTIANNLALPLKLVHVPGCCSPCGWVDPPPELQCYPHGCVRCPNLTIEAGEAMTMNKKVGPYPLPFLRMEVKEVMYCVAEDDLKVITADGKLTVGPGTCGNGHGLQASVTRDVEMMGERAPLVTLCVPLCPAKVS